MTIGAASIDGPERFVGRDDYALHIGGRWVPTEDCFPAIDPSLGTQWARVPQAHHEHVDAAVASATEAFQTWRHSSLAARQALLLAIADRIESDPDRWARLLATENGRPLREAHIADVPASAANFRYFGGVVRALHGEQVPLEDPHALVYTIQEPLGVIAAVLPWNSPIIAFANKVAPAIAAGNAVVVKPSELASISILEMLALIADLLPDGLVNVITGDGTAVESQLVSHPGIAKVAMTGKGPMARRIALSTPADLTPTLMGMAGKSAMIVAADADLDSAVADALMGIYLGNGEARMASSRLLLHVDIAADFVERFAAIADLIVVGDALDPHTQVGPLVSATQHRQVTKLVHQALQDGLTRAAGAVELALPAANRDGYFVRPTLFLDDAGSAPLSREGVFGPVAVAQKFTDYAEAVTRVNSLPDGLAAGVWTQNLGRAHRMAAQLEASVVWVNKWFDLSAGMPMGGIKQNGCGREASVETLREYSSTKVVNVDLGSPRQPLWD